MMITSQCCYCMRAMLLKFSKSSRIIISANGNVLQFRELSTQILQQNQSDEVFDRSPNGSEKLNRQHLDHFSTSESGKKLLKVAIIGSPNAGKSAITNALVEAKISAVSCKVHTTRKLLTAIKVHGDSQMILWDTPGITSREKKNDHSLTEDLIKDPERPLRKADVIAVIVDVANYLSRNSLDARILHLLHRYRDVPSILILNKIDLIVEKSRLLGIAYRLTKGVVDGKPIGRQTSSMTVLDSEKILHDHKEFSQDRIRNLIAEYRTKDENDGVAEESLVNPSKERRKEWHEKLEKAIAKPVDQVIESQLRALFAKEYGWAHFKALFMVSGLTGDGIEELREFLLKNSKDGDWFFDENTKTSQNPSELAKNIIRGYLLDHPNLKQEIPYNIELKVLVWEKNEHDVLCIRMELICPNDRTVKMVIGPQGKYIRDFSQKANQDMRNLFEQDVFLKLEVKSKKKSTR